MRRWLYLLALIFALSLAYGLAHIPVQVSDSLREILQAQASPSAWAAFRQDLATPQFFRPLRVAQIKAVFDLAGGQVSFAYRAVHVLLLIAMVMLFAHVLRVRRGVDVAAGAFALTVLTGLHTFIPLLREAYPINHFLEMILLGLVALWAAQGRGGIARDVVAVAAFVIAALVLESGLLVWVVIVAAWLSGFTGVSRRGVIVATLLLGGYFLWRFAVLDTGAPTLEQRNSGYLFEMLEPEQLQARFGDRPHVFYAYNVLSAASSVLFSEPRGGVWVTARAFGEGDVPPRLVVAVVASALTTLLIVVASLGAIGRWRRGDLDDHDRLLFVFAAVLPANAVLSYAYTKDDIVSFAGAFYALAAYAAMRRALLWAEPARLRAAVVALSVVLAVASSAWAVRALGLHHAVQASAFKTRNDWAVTPGHSIDTPQARALVAQLRRDALERRVAAPRFLPLWAERWFEE